jgi:hypothetical protein
MDVKIIKGDKRDYITVILANGLRVETTFPKKGPFPHDAVHYAVEKNLGLTNAFWGMVAGGRHPEKIGELAKAAGHASASRATVPDECIIELLQAERIVECFEADMWSDPATPALIRQTAKVACESSFVPPLALTDEQISLIRFELAQLSAQWAESRIAFGWGG